MPEPLLPVIQTDALTVYLGDTVTVLPMLDPESVDSIMAHAISERVQTLRQRVADLLHQATVNHELWVRALGPRPADTRESQRWDEVAWAVAAYRDAWGVTVGTPFGEPSTLAQRQDAARIASMVHRLPPMPFPVSAGAQSTVDRPTL